MGVSEHRSKQYTCNACGWTKTVPSDEAPSEKWATGSINFRLGGGIHPFTNWWLCEDCTLILDQFLGGKLKWDEASKHLVLLDERFNDWWTEYCRMESFLKTFLDPLGVGHAVFPAIFDSPENIIDSIKDGTHPMVGEGFRKGECGDK